MSKGPQTDEEALGRLLRRRREFVHAHAPEMQRALVTTSIRVLGKVSPGVLRETGASAAQLIGELWAAVYPEEAEELRIRQDSAPC